MLGYIIKVILISSLRCLFYPKGGIYVLLLLSTLNLFGQRNNDAAVKENKVDTLLIDRDIRNWSIRLFGNSKTQIFRLADDDIRLTYIPNNNFGAGIGLGTKKLILDIAVNIKDPRTDNTDRLDLQGGLVLGNNIFDFHLQIYDGFKVENSVNSNSVFRDDIRSVAIGLDYLFLFNKGEFGQGQLRSGLKNQTRSVTSFGAGAFLEFNQISADRSLVPDEFVSDFNSEAQLTRLSDFGGGLIFGFLGIFKLPGNFFTVFGAKAGAGLMIKDAETEDLSYRPGNPLVSKFNASVILGYRLDRFYTNLNFGGGIYLTDLDFGNDGFFTHAQAKLVFGYRLLKRKK